VLERAVHAVAEQAAKTNTVIDEAMKARLGADHPVTVAAKQVRTGVLKVNAGHVEDRLLPLKQTVLHVRSPALP
jgi:hypothetical protein